MVIIEPKAKSEATQRNPPQRGGTRSSVMGKIISHGKIITVAADKTGTHGSLTPDIGSVSTDVFRRPIFLENNDFALGRISVDKPDGGQTHSHLSEEARCHE